MNLQKKICLLIGVVLASVAQAQIDTTFWFAAPYVCHGHAYKPVVFRISTYSNPANITISEPANSNFTSYSFHLGSYSDTTIDLTGQLDNVECQPYDNVLNYGLKISSTASITAYYEVLALNAQGQYSNPEIFPLKGTIGTGFKFLIPGQTDFANAQAGASYNPQPKNGFIIVAQEDNTTVKIVASNPIIGHNANDTFTIKLNKGQVYAAVAQGYTIGTHIGGSAVMSDKPISVTIYDDSIGPTSTGNRDLIGDQILPENNNGNEFIIVRGNLMDGYNTQDYYYVWATKNNTHIYIDGSGSPIQTLNRGQVYVGHISNASSYIKTDSSVYLYQITGEGGEMASTNLPAITCTGSQLVSFVRSTNETFQLNLLCKAGDQGNFLVNGVAVIPASLFDYVPGTGNKWMAARITSSNLWNIDILFPTGTTSVVSNTTGLFHLGFLNGGSVTGTRLGYFSNYSIIQTLPNVASATCYGSDIQLSSTKISGAIYGWSGPNNFIADSSNPVIKNATTASSGMYRLTVNMNNGCATSTDSVLVNVHPLPTVTFVKSLDTLCYGNSKNIHFNLTGTAPWTFVYNDGIKNDTIKSITQSLSSFISSPKTTTIYSTINIVDSNTCVMSSSTPKSLLDTMMVSALPVANFGYTSPTCEKNTFKFYDSSKTSLDTLTNWLWIFGPNDTVRTIKKDSIPKTYSNWGNETIRLAVQSSLGCKSDTLTKNILVNPLPKPGFILPEVCLTDAFAQFADTTKIADNNYNGFSFHWKFGDAHATVANPDTSIAQNPKHKYSATGQYSVSLKVTSGNICVDSLTQTFKVNGDKPKASFALNNLSTKCSNDSVKITNLSTVNFGDVTWLKIYWDSVNNPAKFDSIPFPSQTGGDVYAHLYSNFAPPSKNFKIHFAAYSGATCVDTKDTIITVTASPVVSFTKMPGICFDALPRQIMQATETNNIPTGAFSYFGNGVAASGVFSPSIAGVGTDTIKALYISSAGCRDSAYQPITVWPSPTAKWGFGFPQCEKNEISFTDSSVANYKNIIKWNWNFGDGTSSSLTGNSVFKKIYAASGFDTASLIVTTDSGCVSNPNTQIISVHPLPHVNYGMQTIVCLPDGKAQFTDSTTIADNTETLFSYKWNFGDVNNTSGSLLKNPVHQYAALGNYSVTLIVTSNNQCIDSITKIFSNIYPQPKANFSTNASEVCMNDSIYFADQTTGFTGSVKTWVWDLAEGYTSSLQNPFRKYSDSGSYTISLHTFDSVGCVSDTISKQVIIDPIPHLTMQHNLVVLEGGSLKLIPVFYVLQPSQFNWTPSTYLDSAAIAYPTTTPLGDITYTLELTGKGNCMISDTVFVKLLKFPTIPNVFSPNGDGINDRWEIKYLDSYPGCEIKVFSRDGQLVFSSVGYNISWDGTLKGKALPIGTYYYIINPKNGRKIMSGSVTIIR